VLAYLQRLWRWINDTPLRQVIGAATALVVVAAGVVVVVIAVQHRGRCAPGVQQRGPRHECVGVTAATYVFTPSLDKVEKAIARENDAVDARQHVTIALLIPLTTPTLKAEILHAVQGAYVAQYRANHEQNDEVPPIRLVLANPGDDSAQWSPVVDQLGRMTGAPDNLRAVIGISVSTQSTEAEVQRLTQKYHIPVVGSTIAADDLANPPGRDGKYPGLSRVLPANSEIAPALAHFGGVETDRALLVEDTRTGDNYTDTLAKAFEGQLKGSPQQPEQYTSPPNVNQEGDTPNQFAQMVPNICQSGVKWIYFAGRQVQLRVFINALGERGCKKQKFSILTGTAASHLGNDPKLATSAFTSGITLDYAADAHPDAWTAPRHPATGGSRQDYEDFTSTLNHATAAPVGPIGPVGGLADGQALLTYDAMWTAVAEIRGASTRANPIPSLTAVANERRALHDVHLVHGASGWICLDNGGNPYDKAVPIVQYQVNGNPRFITLVWPTGSPPATTCTAPFKS
jgi:ABC-type branched-subunit amino acid transport system substrate-binding protein